MAEKPILIIQMQRLGDLVLTYPLLAWLSRLYPDNPLWVVGEEKFYSELMELSPKAVYFSPDAAAALRGNQYAMVINLSHRPEAMALAGTLDTGERLGAYYENGNAVFIRGDWQVYRASIVNNNRYNLFHWADLNVLDTVPPGRLRGTVWPVPEAREPTSSAQIGLFLGASEKDKHPDAAFWAELAKELLHAGHRPALLGGKAEAALGAETARLLGAPHLNLAGRFSISELCRFINGLDLMVTPDTGPMHIAAWIGTPTLNISTGPVNAWETGPFSPGHHVLRAALPCVGCWQCTQSGVDCKALLHPRRTAFLIHELAAGRKTSLDRVALPGQELLATGRDRHNVYQLKPIMGEEQPRQVTARFWQAFFGNTWGVFSDAELQAAWNAFAAASPGNTPEFTRALVKLNRDISAHLRSDRARNLTAPDFWASFPPPLRPLTGYLHLEMQNGLFHKPVIAKALTMVERLVALQR